MHKVFLAIDDVGVAEAVALGAQPLRFDENAPLPSADEYVVCGAQAKSIMFDLRGRLVEPEKLSWLQNGKIRDFYWDRHQPLVDRVALKPPSQPYLACGVSGLSAVMQWRSHELGLIAGPHSQGKSMLAQILAQDFAHRHGAVVSLTCWEDEEEQMLKGFERYRNTVMRDDSKRENFLHQFRTTVIDDNFDRKISEHFDRIEYEAKRFGVKFFILDPWNEFDHEKGMGQTEAEYVIAVMTRAARLTRKLNIIILFTTHVSTEFVSIKSNEVKPFKINNAFGSSQFGNKVHRGFCVARTSRWGEQTHMVVRHDKAKERGSLEGGRKWSTYRRAAHGHLRNACDVLFQQYELLVLGQGP